MKFEALSDYILNKFGLNLKLKYTEHEDYRFILSLRDMNIGYGESYVINIKSGTARIELEVKFESLARKLKEFTLENITQNRREIDRIIHQNPDLHITLNLNESVVWGIAENHVLTGNEELLISLFTNPVDLTSPEKNYNAIIKTTEVIVPLLLLVFPYEDSYYGELEGSATSVVETKYERSRKNRALCLMHHGYTCSICGINFGNFYGPEAKGYIHIHHLNPVSSGEQKVNPFTDLIPLCPNCHAVVHMKNPPYNISEIQTWIKR